MRCPRCGNENPTENRFCGMCGATLLAAVPAGPKPVPIPAVTAPVRSEVVAARIPEVPREPQPAPIPRDDEQPSPSISGPSFLGLGDPAPRRSVQRTRDSLSIDPGHGRGSGNLDYLLEDDEEPRRSGAWKYILILMALALAVGFGYLHFKNQGPAWLNTTLKKPAATTQEPDGTTGSTPAPAPAASNATPSITPDAQPAASTSEPPSESAQSAASGTPVASATANPANPPASGNPATPAPASSDTSKSPDSTNAPNNPDKGAASAPAKDSSADKTASADNADNGGDDSEQPTAKPAVKAPAPKPRAAVPAADPVTEAQKYLYGRGAPQDCDRGLRLLKPAANQGNSKAMVEMGALYSAGLCTPHDLPTAYRWFAMALRKEPDNNSVQSDLQKLWSEMTQPERQLAIKLSQ